MNEDLLLLLRSAEHWLDNYDRAEKCLLPNVSSSSCPLCQVHLLIYLGGCGDCPVRQDTGRDYCRGTPYYAARNTVESKAHESRFPEACQDIGKEYTYLVSLALRLHEEYLEYAFRREMVFLAEGNK